MDMKAIRAIGRSVMKRLRASDVSEAERLTRQEREKADYIPSPSEIEAACLEIQAEWDEAERERRGGMSRERAATWEIPNVREMEGDE